ncbi:MAG: hypothetical protein ACJ763_14970 [Bdellovibrionia bacterium]
MSTNNKPHSETTGNQSGFNWQNGFADSFRDLLGLQVRTAQFVLDKSIGLGQAMTEFYQNQMTETMKLTQEYAKYGWTMTETVKKNAYEATDRTMRGFNG